MSSPIVTALADAAASDTRARTSSGGEPVCEQR
jgi:hypothetical protein